MKIYVKIDPKQRPALKDVLNNEIFVEFNKDLDIKTNEER